jgi:hypothetical protein
MKKVFLILQLLYVKPVIAQSFYLGGNVGFIDNISRQLDYAFVDDNYLLELNAQYVFKNLPIGFDANISYYKSDYGLVNGYVVIGTLTTSGYIYYNPIPKQKKLMLQIKIGAFYTNYFLGYLKLSNDYGPAIGVSLYYKISKKAFLGIDATYLYGLQYYYLYNSFPGEGFVSGFTNINYQILSLCFIHKI